jgi:D-beta-D-heptose 7-phosphate kinase/D-beta-D-heptose 1-phosphate adenosyltransferase
MSGRRILVVGDLMLDRYVIGTVNRISPEAPVPVVLVTSEQAKPGGAANVARNIRALGGQPDLAGLVGDDAAGADLRRVLEESGIRTDAVRSSARVRTAVKTRVVAERQQVVRVDREDSAAQIASVSGEILGALDAVLPLVDGVIMEDYGKGLLTQAVVDRVLGEAARRRMPVGLDPKDTRNLTIKRIALATPNYKEACLHAVLPEVPLGGNLLEHGNLVEAGRRLRSLWDPDVLLITLGAHGMYCLPREGRPVVIPTRAREVFDVTGAGDTVIAASLTALAAGAPPIEAAAIANYAAGVVVGKLGAATCTPEELLAYIGSVSGTEGDGA